MFNSVQQFEEVGINKLLEIEKKFIQSRDFTELETGITAEVLELGKSFMVEILELMDQEIRQRDERKRSGWEVIRQDQKHLITHIGDISFHKTLYKNKKTGERSYLLDDLLDFEAHQRITEKAEASVLEEAVVSSYEKGGESVSLTEEISKTAVMEKIRNLNFAKVKRPVEECRKVPYLYIDADEDHVSLQFQKKKGDLAVSRNGYKNNCVFAKLVYVYEGIEAEAPKSRRNRLIHPHCFCGVYDGKENGKLWQEVYTYLKETYDLGSVRKVYLNADGGSWIKGAKQYLHGLTRVMDEFHINKYLLRMTGGLLDSAGDAREELVKAIRKGTAEEFSRITEHILEVTESATARHRIAESAEYILNNWMPAKIRLQHGKRIIGCSAEGHVSHVLSDRMSSRPLGWSREGADQMARLRAYYYNQGDMLELVRAQKLPKAAGAEETELILSPGKLGEKIRQSWGKYVDHANHEVSIATQKMAWLRAQISYI